MKITLLHTLLRWKGNCHVKVCSLVKKETVIAKHIHTKRIGLIKKLSRHLINISPHRSLWAPLTIWMMNDECCKFFNTHKKVNRETESAATSSSEHRHSERTTTTTVGRSSCAPMFTSDLLLLNSATFRFFSKQGFSWFCCTPGENILRSLEVYAGMWDTVRGVLSMNSLTSKLPPFLF